MCVTIPPSGGRWQKSLIFDGGIVYFYAILRMATIPQSAYRLTAPSSEGAIQGLCEVVGADIIRPFTSLGREVDFCGDSHKKTEGAWRAVVGLCRHWSSALSPSQPIG